MNARQEILDRLRAALHDAPVAPEVPRGYRRGSELDEATLIELLVDRLEDYKAHVDVIAPADVPATLVRLLEGEDSYVIPPGLPESWLDDPVLQADASGRRITDTPHAPLEVTALDATGAVVTSSAISIAESGTIVLDGSPDQGRRAITLVPDHHICVVPVSTIVQILPEAMPRLEGTRPLTMISGPSATSDIELERVEGVHGPRRLDVVIVRGL